MASLREARNAGKIAEFVADRGTDPPGDKQVFDATLKAMAGTSKSAPGTSKRRRSAD